mmetsp:Transcript_5849/g.6356  ORF Transcript_5849/g.6356 Transcript_5849/m.6356 type:complete len:375 (+) Transcript_5849:94-1218(+)
MPSQKNTAYIIAAITVGTLFILYVTHGSSSFPAGQLVTAAPGYTRERPTKTYQEYEVTEKPKEIEVTEAPSLQPTKAYPYSLVPPRIFKDNTMKIYTYPIVDTDKKCDVALTTALSSAGDNLTKENLGKIHLIKDFFPTLHPSLTPGYWYCLYFGVDTVDPFFGKVEGQQAVVDWVRNWAKENKVQLSYISWSLVPFKKHSAWAHNDAVMTAHRDGVEWFFRVNDDTRYTSKNWTGRFIEELNKLNKIGVVGPSFSRGNTQILTYDFTHRTHIHIYGYHWPRAFPNWYGDDWITQNYKPNNIKKLKDITIEHIVHSSRYLTGAEKSDPGLSSGMSTAEACKTTKAILKKYLECRKTKTEIQCRNFDYTINKVAS